MSLILTIGGIYELDGIGSEMCLSCRTHCLEDSTWLAGTEYNKFPENQLPVQTEPAEVVAEPLVTYQ